MALSRIGRGFDAVTRSALCFEPVGGSTHNYYRYPARFSPAFARAAIENLTKPGDTVFDPFMGGGTAAVEALASGRRFVGCDLNPLSVFLAKVKTQALSEVDLAAVANWADDLAADARLGPARSHHSDWVDYQVNMPWWIRQAVEVCLDAVEQLETPDRTAFGRCAVLKTAQWALDCRRDLPSGRSFLEMFRQNIELMARGMREYRARLKSSNTDRPGPNRRLFLENSEHLRLNKGVPKSWLPPKLVITSPPYPGVHILYHRWQVQGRRETPAPFWVIDSLDGYGASHYTFGDRRRRSMGSYFERIARCFSAIATLMGPESLLVQLVAFSNVDLQLGPFLAALDSAGLREIALNKDDNRVHRRVPNRKWYTQVTGADTSAREILFVHARG